MAREPLLLKAIMKPAARRADDSISVKFDTAEEVSTEDFKVIDDYRGQTGWLMFKANEPTADEIPEGEAVVEGVISPSQRLRKALFRKHMHMGGNKDNFAPYYKKVMEGFIRSVNESYDQ